MLKYISGKSLMTDTYRAQQVNTGHLLFLMSSLFGIGWFHVALIDHFQEPNWKMSQFQTWGDINESSLVQHISELIILDVQALTVTEQWSSGPKVFSSTCCSHYKLQLSILLLHVRMMINYRWLSYITHKLTVGMLGQAPALLSLRACVVGWWT